jgi:transcriptional regulator with XRE-family HTH domain
MCRRVKGWSVLELARQTHINRNTLMRIESGHLPILPHAIILANLFGLTLDELCDTGLPESEFIQKEWDAI